MCDYDPGRIWEKTKTLLERRKRYIKLFCKTRDRTLRDLDVEMSIPFKYCDFQCVDDARFDTDTKLIEDRVREIVERKQDGYPLTKFKTDRKHCNAKVSDYTEAFARRFGLTVDQAVRMSNRKKAKLTGVPLEQLKAVYKKGVAAHKTGHRVGASPQAWGKARVNSFLQNGCTAFATDHLQMEEAIENMDPDDVAEWMRQPVMCRTLFKPYYQQRLEKLVAYRARLCEHQGKFCEDKKRKRAGA